MTDAERMPTPILVLRPFGYLLVTLAYALLLAVVVALGWGGLFAPGRPDARPVGSSRLP